MTQPRILVIDDDRSILELVCELLADAGYAVHGTVDAIEGLSLVREQAPDLIVLDMRMPIMNGWQFKQALDEHELAVPIVVMTAAQNARQWASEVDAIGYVAKPFDIDNLLSVVEGSLTENHEDSASQDSVSRISLLGELSNLMRRVPRVAPALALPRTARGAC